MINRWLRFNWWYYRNPPWDTGVSPPELLEFLDRRAPGRALDLGCGSGTNLATLAQRGWQAIGVDFALPAVWRANRKLRAAGLQQRASARVGDVTRLRGVRGLFDLVLDIGCFHGLPQQVRLAYLANLERWLAPSGAWLLYAHLRPDLSDARGLAPEEVAELSRRFDLALRQDGADQGRPSAWFTFHKP